MCWGFVMELVKNDGIYWRAEELLSFTLMWLRNGVKIIEFGCLKFVLNIYLKLHILVFLILAKLSLLVTSSLLVTRASIKSSKHTYITNCNHTSNLINYTTSITSRTSISAHYSTPWIKKYEKIATYTSNIVFGAFKQN